MRYPHPIPLHTALASTNSGRCLRVQVWGSGKAVRDLCWDGPGQRDPAGTGPHRMQHPLQWSTRLPLGKGLFAVLLQEPFLRLTSTVLRTISPWGAPVHTSSPGFCAELGGCSFPPCRLSPKPQLSESRLSSSREPEAQELVPLATRALNLLARSVLEWATGEPSQPVAGGTAHSLRMAVSALPKICTLLAGIEHVAESRQAPRGRGAFFSMAQESLGWEQEALLELLGAELSLGHNGSARRVASDHEWARPFTRALYKNMLCVRDIKKDWETPTLIIIVSFCV